MTCETQNKLIDLKKAENKASIFWEVLFRTKAIWPNQPQTSWPGFKSLDLSPDVISNLLSLFSVLAVVPLCITFFLFCMFIVSHMFGGNQQWDRVGHKHELCSPVCEYVLLKWAVLLRSQQGPCDMMLRGQAQHWDILLLQSPQRVFWTLVEWELREGCMGGTGAVHEWGNSRCHLLSFSGSGLFKHPLTRLMETRSPSQPRRVPRHHGTTIRINPCTCAESTVGVCLFCDWAWEGEGGGGGGWGGGWRAAWISVWKDTRQPFTFVKWNSGGEHEWSYVEGHNRRILITKSDQSNFH